MKPEDVLKKEQLYPRQLECVEAIERGENVLVTGPAGTGKSALLKYLRTVHPDMPVTASTGIAALNVGGVTLHSWGGLGMGNRKAEDIAGSLMDKRNAVWMGMRRAERVAIDEISMVDAELLQKLDTVMRIVRKKDKPFGGCQMIFFGDFLQLPPVGRQGEPVLFAFQSESWIQSGVKVFLLDQILRQADKEFADILSRVRIGDSSEEVRAILRPRILAADTTPEIEPVILATHNSIADGINAQRMSALDGPDYVWKAQDFALGDFAKASLDKNCIAPSELVLRVGAQVMLLKNIDPGEGLVNGSVGELIKVEDHGMGMKVPVVKFANGVIRGLDREQWALMKGEETIAERQQIPLRPSWAISIHKSQGMSIDKVSVHLKKVFADGQAYVAMSRARTLGGLFIQDIGGHSIRANPVALEFYERHSA